MAATVCCSSSLLVRSALGPVLHMHEADYAQQEAATSCAQHQGYLQPVQPSQRLPLACEYVELVGSTSTVAR